MSKPRVYVTRRLPQTALDIIGRACEYEIWDSDLPVPPDTLAEKVKEVDGLLCLLTDKVTDSLLAAAPNLKVVANMAVGYDNIDVAAASKRGVLVTNTPGVLTETTADLAWALLMATARRITDSERRLRAGEWQTWKPMEFTGQDVYGATLGLIGMGNIGAATARRALGFGMRILYHNRRRNPMLEAALGCEYVDLDTLLKESDFVSLHCPLTEETRHLISDRELKLMKKSAVLINTARGPVVDEDALVRALQAGEIWAAGIDVYSVEPVPLDHPLLKLENVVTLPHIGSASIRTRTRMATLAAENVVAALTGKEPPTPVNAREVGKS